MLKLIKNLLNTTGLKPENRKEIRLDKILDDYGKLLESVSVLDVFFDVCVLPHPKDQILLAIEEAILNAQSDNAAASIMCSSVFLAQFLEDVGPKPLFWTGTDIRSVNETLPKDQVRILAKAMKEHGERLDHFMSAMKTEEQRISMLMNAALGLRRARRVSDIPHERAPTSTMGLSLELKDIALRAANGDVEAQFDLAEAYFEGNGVASSPKTAVYWWTKAAERGSAAAQHQLGCAYSEGLVVSQDYITAYMWFTLAWTADEGIGPRIFYSPSSDEKRRKIRKFLKPVQVSEAKRRARQWRTKTGVPGSLSI